MAGVYGEESVRAGVEDDSVSPFNDGGETVLRERRDSQEKNKVSKRKSQGASKRKVKQKTNNRLKKERKNKKSKKRQRNNKVDKKNKKKNNGRKRKGKGTKNNLKKNGRRKVGGKKKRGKGNKRGRRKKKKGNNRRKKTKQSSCSSEEVTYTCMKNAMEGMMFEKNQITNYLKQAKRLENHGTISTNKVGKKGEFELAREHLLWAIGGDISDPKCGPNTTAEQDP